MHARSGCKCNVGTGCHCRLSLSPLRSAAHRLGFNPGTTFNNSSRHPLNRFVLPTMDAVEVIEPSIPDWARVNADDHLSNGNQLMIITLILSCDICAPFPVQAPLLLPDHHPNLKFVFSFTFFLPQSPLVLIILCYRIHSHSNRGDDTHKSLIILFLAFPSHGPYPPTHTDTHTPTGTSPQWRESWPSRQALRRPPFS